MRASQYLLATFEKNPLMREVISHKLIFACRHDPQTGGGALHVDPTGLRVLRKVERIVREEMDRSGAQEVLMPVTQPAELWTESGRFQAYGPELLRFGSPSARFRAGPDPRRSHQRSGTRKCAELGNCPPILPDSDQVPAMKRVHVSASCASEFLMKDSYTSI